MALGWTRANVPRSECVSLLTEADSDSVRKTERGVFAMPGAGPDSVAPPTISTHPVRDRFTDAFALLSTCERGMELNNFLTNIRQRKVATQPGRRGRGRLRSPVTAVPHTIRPVKPTEPSAVAGLSRIEPFLLGTVLSGVSSLAYSCSNVCLRWLAQCDPLLVSCIKAVPTLLFATALVLIGVSRGTTRWPAMPAFLGLAAVGVLAQLGGNGLFQWSMGEVGLALTVPLCAGTMIIAATILGRVWLGEGVTPRSAIALTILISAIGVLSLGAERAATGRTGDGRRLDLGRALCCLLVGRRLRDSQRHDSPRGNRRNANAGRAGNGQ